MKLEYKDSWEWLLEDMPYLLRTHKKKKGKKSRRKEEGDKKRDENKCEEK